ncbi:MAG TPA: DUF2470 domain-containing protein [Solirubrobacteraceae bacterium]|nr:DUF2470 domain-containing protein [Solirubrobacteraceae bacterium]
MTTGDSMTQTAPQLDHEIVGEVPPPPPGPLLVVEPGRRRTAAEEARALVATHSICSLATLTADGDPWASLVSYGAMDDGAPVLYVSTLAEHGRNLAADRRASIVVAETVDPDADPLDSPRVTLLGVAHRPEGDELEAARAAHFAALPIATSYQGFGDFSFWVLRVRRVRWVGGYGRMDSADAASYAAAEPDPVAPVARQAIAHLNADHADALLAMARALGGHPDATAARVARLDRYGMDLLADTPRGADAPARVPFAEPVAHADDLRAATVELARRARAA